MHDPAFYQRTKQLYRMLFELATGNLSFRIEKDDKDAVGKLCEALNTFAAQMQLAIRKSGYVLPYYTYQNLAYAAFILDESLLVIALSKDAVTLLNREPGSVEGKPFISLLSAQSKLLWQELQSEMFTSANFQSTAQLQFETANGKLSPVLCSVCRLIGTDDFLVSSVTTILQEIAELNQSATVEVSDARIIQQLYDHIMDNLDKPLPTIKELAQRFGTNEFKLKSGFRQVFNSGIYHFYNVERLKRAHTLILQSNQSLKSIAFLCGFNDYVTFSKAFKKQFGYGPGSVARIINK